MSSSAWIAGNSESFFDRVRYLFRLVSCGMCSFDVRTIRVKIGYEMGMSFLSKTPILVILVWDHRYLFTHKDARARALESTGSQWYVCSSRSFRRLSSFNERPEGIWDKNRFFLLLLLLRTISIVRFLVAIRVIDS